MIAEVTVLRSQPETPSTHAVRFTKPQGFRFLPVQFVGLEFDTDEGPIEYPMSLACSPTKDYLEFAVRRSESPWKRAFCSLEPGDEAEVDGPYGHFVLDEARPAVLVAGGIGITPLKGMLEYGTDKALPLDMALVYSNKSPEEIVFRRELDDLARHNPRSRILYTITRPEKAQPWDGRVGRIDAALLREAAKGLEDPVHYVCGKPEMVEGVVRLLRDLGVPPSRMRWEEFFGYA